MSRSPAVGSDVDPRTPLVSIVVPSFNGAGHLREALDSIVGQTYGRTEVIVMDNASTDKTEEIVGSYGDAVSHCRQSHTRGMFENVNDGIAQARGDLVAIYHADDVYHPEIVEREVAYLTAHADVGAVFCKHIFINAEGQPYGRQALPAETAGGTPMQYADVLNALLRYKNCFLGCPSSMVRASVYRELGGYDQQRFHENSDLEMWLRIARHHRLGVIDEYLYWYRRGHGSVSDHSLAQRANPERFFEILDLELAQVGRALVDDESLVAYEAHRARDQLRVAAGSYILAQRGDARAALDAVHARRIVGSERVPRARLLVLLTMMHALVRLPRIGLAAQVLDRGLFRSRTPAPWPDCAPPAS